MSRESARSGVLVVDKGRGATSFDVVALARRRLGVRHIGHAGTLDPDATGVLPILVGEATKLTPYLVDQDKEYVATLRFGVTTDTHDVSGRVLSETRVADLTPARLEVACRAFEGTIKQVPPMYSAVHHRGRRLYELAREGIEVERTAREVVISSIAIENVDAPLTEWPSVRLDAPGAAAFAHGQAADVIPAAAAAEGFVRVHDADGPMIGVGELTAGGSKVRPVRILHADRPRPRILPA